MAEPVPTLTLRAEYHPMIPKKLIGYGVFDGDKLVGIITLETMMKSWPEKLIQRVKTELGRYPRGRI
jgi:predicted transcriptional regulator